jgi:hypothetical protein
MLLGILGFLMSTLKIIQFNQKTILLKGLFYLVRILFSSKDNGLVNWIMQTPTRTMVYKMMSSR